MELHKEIETDTSPERMLKKRRKNSSASTSAASVDSNSDPLPIGEYEVFLNFRGADTRENITDILYHSLILLRIRTFRDEEELDKGQKIWANLETAIHQSQISIPIFSPQYAESKSCLRELVEITERRKREKGHIILPIFYLVNPTDVRHQRGPYEKAFDDHTTKDNVDGETLQRWRAAMKEVGDDKGWHIQSRTEEVAVADAVCKVVWSHLHKNNNTIYTDELVGIDDHVKNVVHRLDLDSKGVNLVGIHGIGGVGKTTLAKAVYNKISALFDGYSFVEDIRETLKPTDGVLVLQRKFLSNILRMKSVESVIEAKNIIRNRVTRNKILVVLDDVDEKFNFKEVLGDLESFASGSRFIVTSRNIHVLEILSRDQNKLYEVQGMNDSHSLQLFYKLAFREDPILPGFEGLSKEIVSKAGGLPLALKVIGSLLWRQKRDFWEAKLKELREMPNEDVMEVLMISYTTLNENAQQIFLDVACFHIGENKEKASYMWEDCKYYPGVYVDVLIQRSMLKIGDYNEFQMHDQLRDMGREIVRKENIEYPEKRSRIWLEEEGNDVLHNHKGTKKVRAIRGGGFFRQDQVRAISTIIGSEYFTDMTGMRYFHGTEMDLIGDFSDVLPNLKWICLSFSEFTATNFNMKNMVIFDVNGCGIDDIPTKDAKKLKVLEIGNCSEMSKLPEFPESLEVLDLCSFSNEEEDMELGNLHNLKVLRLKYCTLGRIKGSPFGMMEELRELNFTYSKFDFDNFRRVIADIGQLSSLEIFKFHSPEMKNVLEGIKLPKRLKVLETSSCFHNLSELLDLEDFSFMDDNNNFMSSEFSIERTTTEVVISSAAKLKSMKLSFKKSRISMVEGLNAMLPSSLTIIHIYHLQSNQIPNLKNLSNLTELELRKCPCLQEIQGLGGLKSLQILSLFYMEKLAKIEGLGNLMSSSDCKLTEVVIVGCPLLRALQTFEQHDDDTNDAVQIESLLKLQIMLCPLMDCRSIPTLSKFPRLRKLSIKEIGSNINDESGSQQEQLLEGLDNLGELVLLRRLPSLSKLTKLEKLTLSSLPCLQEIVRLGAFKSLKEVYVSNCISLKRLTIEDLTKLEKLEVINLPCLREIVGLRNLKSLEALEVRGCILFERMLVEDLTKLTKLTLSDLPRLREIVGLGNLKSLEALEVRGCILLERMFVEDLTKLTKLTLSDLPRLREIVGLGNLKSLEALEVRDCILLERMLVEDLTKLTKLTLSDLPRLREIVGLGDLKSLKELQVNLCISLERMLVEDLTELTKLTLYDLPCLREIVGLGDLKSLKELEVSVCISLERMLVEDLTKLTKLSLSDLPRLREIVGLGDLKSLKELEVSVCISLERMLVEDLTKLTVLIVSGLPCLREIVGLGDLKSLQQLEVRRCISLERLPVEDLTKLTVLIVYGLPCLQEIVGLGALKSLQQLEVRRCISLERLPVEDLTKLEKLEVINLPCLQEIVGLGALKSLQLLEVRRCISLERMPVEGLSYSTMFHIKLDLPGCTKFTNAHSDLSPLTTEGAFYPRGLEVKISWPEEHLWPFQRGSRIDRWKWPSSEESDDDTWEESDDDL